MFCIASQYPINSVQEKNHLPYTLGAPPALKLSSALDPWGAPCLETFKYKNILFINIALDLDVIIAINICDVIMLQVIPTLGVDSLSNIHNARYGEAGRLAAYSDYLHRQWYCRKSLQCHLPALPC